MHYVVLGIKYYQYLEISISFNKNCHSKMSELHKKHPGCKKHSL